MLRRRYCWGMQGEAHTINGDGESTVFDEKTPNRSRTDSPESKIRTRLVQQEWDNVAADNHTNEHEKDNPDQETVVLDHWDGGEERAIIYRVAVLCAML
jgi:hypothetical protein